jgi:hypothetical protein
MSEIDLTEWNRWFSKFVHPIFEVAERESYFNLIKRLQTPFYPKYWVSEMFYTKIKDDNRFDNELKEFFSFLYSCGFFMDNVINFEEWLSMRNWENPSNVQDGTYYGFVQNKTPLIIPSGQPAWNDYSKMYVYEVPPNVTIKAWVGNAAPQKISNNVQGFHLSGGTEQIFIPYINQQDATFQSIVNSMSTGW